MKPAARPPSRPRPKKPGCVAGVPKRGCDDGCVMLRWIGAACDGAVRVVGGAENGREPRPPAPKPPPAPAAAVLASMPSVSATAKIAMSLRKEMRIIWNLPAAGMPAGRIFAPLYRVAAADFEGAIRPQQKPLVFNMFLQTA